MMDKIEFSSVSITKEELKYFCKYLDRFRVPVKDISIITEEASDDYKVYGKYITIPKIWSFWVVVHRNDIYGDMKYTSPNFRKIVREEKERQNETNTSTSQDSNSCCADIHVLLREILQKLDSSDG